MSWEYPEFYAPAIFHTKKGFSKFRTWINSLPTRKHLETICLGLGLALRNTLAAQTVEPGADDHPLVNSELGVEEYEQCVQWSAQLELWIKMNDSRIVGG